VAIHFSSATLGGGPFSDALLDPQYGRTDRDRMALIERHPASDPVSDPDDIAFESTARPQFRTDATYQIEERARPIWHPITMDIGRDAKR